MAGTIEVDFDGIQLAIDGLIEDLSDLNLSLQTFDAESEFLLQLWEGDAAEAFRTAQQSWAQDGEVRREELERMIAALGEVLHIYTSTEQRLRDLCGAE
ncbi:WXG100 family type VII secretion target [Microbacterium sp. NPDC087589]|uniref:WXG100 family type VII secretion target n=1 Tax=Microbacterium sp. NPDC087589 TaxID=3364191 RepID=UPI0037FAD0F9